ncbi:MAG: diaminopimelate decarboxylase [Candidatus Omnitrophica bacterium]|nr:diaminopimelate decarboxylase [Candidatus Omnitrophota bacterium]MBU1127725.1 diaminopimelate decarboxylase [Candidatus Omnitrophota bacterium]MBU1656759.1 diaminopimelate decarboxylase [Candidatus Omnitrophota bacterium]MBU1784289.1 diaminopimelate decarboxylase [Candidatus Omnitrophota bacterium]MBU1852275.1 diaminopimelate decarboxylase [Candidatus Omnitrophota bacterium]
MHEFNYRGDTLCCENVPLPDIIKEHPTPFYLYSHKTLVDHFNKIKAAFKELNPLICFSMKSNSNLNVCKALVAEGAGLDIVSGGELYKALKAGCPADRLVYASVGKTESEIEYAIRKNIFAFNVESVPELIMIDSVARRLARQPRVALRLNPDVKADTHDYITTGTKEKKFGIDFKTAEDIFDNTNKYSNVSIKGIHAHIGSQITNTEPFAVAIRKILDFIEKSNIVIEWLNIGGGFGIDYGVEKARTAEDFAAKIIPLLSDKKFKLVLEPGRFIAGAAGILVCKVLYVKATRSGKKFAIVDAGMNDLIRPSLYNAHHEILSVVKLRSKPEKYDIVGPICESGDFLALDREFPGIVAGGYLAVMSAGAYGFVMSSNYNSRPRSSELMVINGGVNVVRAAETYRDLIRGEKILKEFK